MMHDFTASGDFADVLFSSDKIRYVIAGIAVFAYSLLFMLIVSDMLGIAAWKAEMMLRLTTVFIVYAVYKRFVFGR